jgi:Tfp pilus assembly protein PilO
MKKSIFTLIIFLVVAAVFIGLIFPSFQESRDLSAKFQQKQKELEELEDYLSHLQKISAQLKEFTPQLSKIDQALYGDSYLPNLFVFLQQEAAKNGLNLEQITIGQQSVPKEGESLTERTINLQLSGAYPNFKSFLISLEGSARIIEVVSLSLSAKSLKESPKFGLIIKVYSE